jgi:hypothetical protein
VVPRKESAADRLYREQMGAQAYHRQVALEQESRACTCGLKNMMPGRFHAPQCPAIPYVSRRK